MPTSSSNFYTTATNQLTSSSMASSISYDAAGNVTYDGQNSYLYDAEGRICAVENGSGKTGYVYDAGGIRVAKGSLTSFSCDFTANGYATTTSWVLGPAGEQVTEYSVSGGTGTWQHTNAFASGALLATYHDTDTYFALNDWLGTKRAEVSAGGQIASYRSLAYGNGFTPVGSATDATEQHFTGKERDGESGNDYFGARYYASSMGRFMSPDWAPRPWAVPYADFTNPQTLNLYQYMHNNPLGGTDPDGHGPFLEWAANKVATYLGTHPDVTNAMGHAVDKAVNSLGVKVFAGLGVKAEVGPVKLNANATFNAQSSVDGKKDGLSLQGTVGAKAGDVGAQLTGTAPLANGDGLVNPLSGAKLSGSATGSSSLTDKVDGMDAGAKAGGSLSPDTASVGVTVNGGVALVGAQVSSDISGWKDVAAAVVSNAVSDAKQFVSDVKTAATCNGTSGCSTPH